MTAFSKTAVPAVQLLVSACLLVAIPSASHAGDVRAGRAKAMMCQACHGLDGLSKPLTRAGARRVVRP